MKQQTQSIQLAAPGQPVFKDAKCPVFLADAQQVAMWCHGDAIVRVQFRGLHFTDPATGVMETYPVAEIAMPLGTFFSLQDGANNQAEQMEKQGIKRVSAAQIAPVTGTPPKH
jgi:hypothetical protein